MLIEKICDTMPFHNGSDPVWSRGNSVIVRVGDRVFATNSRVFPKRALRSRTSLELYEKCGDEPWKMVYYDEGVFQRESCPILYLGDHKLAVTVNPTARVYAPDEPNIGAACIPMVYIFDISGEVQKIDTIRLTWDDPEYFFHDHSYRGFTLDTANGNLFLVNQYIVSGGAHCYALCDHTFKTLQAGKLDFPVRSCYHNMAMRDGELYVFALRDIVEPNAAWKQYKFEKTGNEWDYDFRRVYLRYSPDITKEALGEAVSVCDRDDTCGWIYNIDCSYDKQGDMLFLVSVQNVHFPFMKERFFPDAALETVLELYRFRKGQLVETRILDRSADEEGHMTQYGGFFHTASNGDVYIVWSKETDLAYNKVKTGTYLSKVEALEEEPVMLMDRFATVYGNKTRLGAAGSDMIDMYWPENSERIMYGRYDLRK